MQQTTPLGKNLEQAQIWEHWEELTGKHLAKHCRPHSIKKGQLRIIVESPVWMHKISYLKWDLLLRINRMAGKELVSDAFFVLASDEEALNELEPT
jgi:predicted nucleic acid-binding Zn ribbon protein